MELACGSILAGRYRLDAPIGAGGMGQVWAATHVLTRRSVAIKRLVLPRDDLSAGEARARFVLEAQSACAVAHPNVVEVFDLIDLEGDSPFLVMELLRGETLAAKLARERVLSPRETATLLLQVVSAVGTAHALGIIHRDVKPSNIFLCSANGSRPRVKVLDFGIAKWLRSERGGSGLRTQTGSTLGTPCYMSPEQATNERSVDHRVDIWSLGVILYECLSGVRPLEGDSPAQLVMVLLSTGIMPIEQLLPALPSPLALLIGRMLAREPARRPADLREVFEILEPFAEERAPAFGAPSRAPDSVREAAPVAVLPAQPRSDTVVAMPAAVSPTPAQRPWLSERVVRRDAKAARILRLGLNGAVVALGMWWLWGAAALRGGGVARSDRAPLVDAPGSIQQPIQSLQPAAADAGSARASAGITSPGTPLSTPLAPRVVPSKKPVRGEAARAAPRPVAKTERPPHRTSSTEASSSVPEGVAERPPASSVSGLPRGAECEHSRDCQSHLCIAFHCK